MNEPKDQATGTPSVCHCYVAICAACGYQWDETAESTFELECKSCNANIVHESAFDKTIVMGDDYDGVPWF